MTGTPDRDLGKPDRHAHREEERCCPTPAGPGKYRGGLGQEIVLRNDTGHPLTVACLAGRTEFPPLGLHGGKPADCARS